MRSAPNNIVLGRVAIVIITLSSSFGILQSLTWSILSVLSMLYYKRHIMPNIPAIYSQSNIGRTIYDFYLNSRYEEPLIQAMTDFPLVITAKSFFVLNIIYFIMSFLWLMISIAIIWTLSSKKFMKEIVATWTVMVGVVSLFDLIVTFLLSANYSQIQRFQDSHNYGPSPTDTVVLASTGIVMTIAARGFILWIINVILGVLMGNYCYYYYTGVSLLNSTQTPLSRELSSQTLLPWEESKSVLGETESYSYDRVGLRPNNPQMVRAVNNKIVDTSLPPTTYPKPSRWEQNLPTLTAPPFIPEPDYTPPVSPIMRRGLQPRKS